MLSINERRQQIVQQAQNLGKVMVDDLAMQFAVSTVTIRAGIRSSWTPAPRPKPWPMAWPIMTI